MCWKCGKDIAQERVYRQDVCPVCGSYLHSCRNCQFYAPGSHYDCKESIEDLVADKETANFCDSYRVHRSFDPAAAKASAAEKLKKLDSLFNI